MAPVTVRLDRSATVGQVDRRLFGSFVEHLGRCVYTGVFEPGHPTADEHGFRGDVLELTRELGVTTIRYPGGNFVSSYRWEDGVGPVAERPTRLDLNWHSTEPNTFGTNEFITWCRAANVEPMMAVNIGTRGTAEALDLLEYCNHPGGTALSDLRRAHGHPEPHNVRMWCLGNEMDGPWQIGHMTPERYAWAARDMAAAMRKFDSALELVACGSSGRGMPTFGVWERAVLEAAYDDVDFISAHAYYEELGGDLASFLASAADMDAFITGVVEIADEVGAARGSDKKVMVSFDEWNVWYLSKGWEAGTEDWPVAPPLLEDVYSAADAVVVGDLLITLLRHADRVKAASLAQLVNVIAPIMTEPGGRAWRQTTFHPFALTSRHTQPQVLQTVVGGSARHETAKHGEVDAVNAVATWDGAGAVTVFAVNRDPRAAHPLVVDLAGLAGGAGSGPGVAITSATATVLHDVDPYAANTADDPERVIPREGEALVEGSSVTVELPPVSWAMLQVELR